MDLTNQWWISEIKLVAGFVGVYIWLSYQIHQPEIPMTEPTGGVPATPNYEERFGAPIVYFDFVAANGIMNGAIEIELAHRVLTPGAGTDVKVTLTTSARLRCSPIAARAPIEGLQNALKMLDQPQAATAATKLN